MNNPLILCALKEEYFNDLEPPFWDIMYTGIGKINATMAVMKKIFDEKYQRYDFIINVGSCGSKKYKTGDIVRCQSFLEWDRTLIPGFIDDSVIYEDDISSSVILPYTNVRCGSSDLFMENEVKEARVDVYDMESYALAKVCREYYIPFLSIKYVSDSGNLNYWQTSLPKVRVALGKALKLLAEKLDKFEQ